MCPMNYNYIPSENSDIIIQLFIFLPNFMLINRNNNEDNSIYIWNLNSIDRVAYMNQDFISCDRRPWPSLPPINVNSHSHNSRFLT